MKPRRSLGRFSGVALIAVLLSQHAVADPVQECRNLYRLTDLHYAVQPGRIVPAQGDVPTHCRARGVVNRAIQVEVRMPIEGWNGRFMFSPPGGWGGYIDDTQSLLSRGYAMASTDTGHDESDQEFMAQPEAVLDYAFRGVHLATVFAKSVVKTFYGDEIEFSYLKGCSNGGRAALHEAIRFPEDYDGIIAGSPFFRMQEHTPWVIEVARHQRAHTLDEAAIKLLGETSLEACDGLDGVLDGVINDPRLCTEDVYDLDKLVCKDGVTDGCLTAGQIETARFIYGGQRNDAGEMVSPGVSPGAEDHGEWQLWLEEYWNLPEGSPGEEWSLPLFLGDPDIDVETFDTANDRALLDDLASYMDVQTADLTEFRERGGKIIMYQGWNDFPLRAQRAIDYFTEVQAVNGRSNADDFFKLFMVPGFLHCTGGPGAWVTDYVEPLVTWREKGQAPERLIAASVPMCAHISTDAFNNKYQGKCGPDGVYKVPSSEDAKVRFTRALCAYPKQARYKGTGNANEAKNWRCEK